MKKNENNIILKQWVRVFLLVVVVTGIIISVVSIFKSLNPEQNDKEELYSYNYNSNLNYRVYLKNNSFFTSSYLGMNKQYITSLIDHIEVDAKYNLKASKELDYTYSYEVVATTKGLYQNSDGKDVEVWSKAYPIANLTTQSGSGSTINISKTVSLDYNNYNEIMTDFRNQFGLSVDARVDLSVKINVKAGLKGESEKGLQTDNKMSLEIPLLQQTISIKPNYVNSGSDTIYKATTTKTDINMPILIVSALTLLVLLYIFNRLVKSLLVVTRKSEYVLSFNKILKEYADIIAETHNMPDLDNYDVINVKNFNDLVDVEEEVHSPILCFEVKENVECVFTIINNKVAYKFVLRESDFDHFSDLNTSSNRKKNSK